MVLDRNKAFQLSGLTFSQPLYIDVILKRFGMINAMSVSAPMIEAFWSSLAKDRDKSKVEAQLYQQMLGSLLYLGLCTRPDILAAVLISARFQKGPTGFCHPFVKRKFRYLWETTDYELRYEQGLCYLKRLWKRITLLIGLIEKKCLAFFVNEDKYIVVSASETKNIVSLSTCESEHHAMILVPKEAIWIRLVLLERENRSTIQSLFFRKCICHQLCHWWEAAI